MGPTPDASVSFAHVILPEPVTRAAERFWAAALDASWRPGPPGSPWAASLVPGGGDPYVHRAGPGLAGVALALEVDGPGPGADDPAGPEVRRSPGGLAYALLPSVQHRRAPAADWPDGTTSRLVQVCLDCPPEGAEAEAAFWRATTGWALERSASPAFVGHLVPPTGSLQLLVQRRASREPDAVTVHLDLGASDREAEAGRLVALGATRRATGDGWIVLADPDGRVFCATGQPPEAP